MELELHIKTRNRGESFTGLSLKFKNWPTGSAKYQIARLMLDININVRMTIYLSLMVCKANHHLAMLTYT